MAFPDEIYLENDFNVQAGTIEEPLIAINADTGVAAPFTGRPVECFLAVSDSFNAEPLHTDLRVDMTEDVGIPGLYWGGFNGDVLSLRLSALVDTRVYVIFRSLSDWRITKSVMLRGPRPV